MRIQRTHINDLHFEHEMWLSETAFYGDQLKIYQKRLDEISKRNNMPDVAKEIDHFQNQFIIQKEQMDILDHEVRMHEQWLTTFAKDHPVALEHRYFGEHTEIFDKMETFKRLFQELREEFYGFMQRKM
jgi:hypothetical protein